MPHINQSRVGILNVTGYAGIELVRLLWQHPNVELVSVTGRSEVEKRLGTVFPHLGGIDLVIEAECRNVEVVFSALPHKSSAEAILPLLKEGVRVVDISADFRLKDAEDYPRWYNFAHPAPHLLQEAVYGLPELHRTQLIPAQLVANPGCYPTGAILALAPAVKEGIISSSIIIDSKSGVSGAGRALSMLTHYPEVNENIQAYALEGHRHLPEVVQELGVLDSNFAPRITFIPHLVPLTRGILTSCYADIIGEKITPDEKGKKELREIYQDFYKDEPFTKITDTPPQTKQVWGTNFCLIYPTLDIRTGRLIVITCIDNLVKGAGGQAIQNMNLMLGFAEATGLEQLAVYP